MTPTSTAIYCRISQDRQGAGLGVQRQEEDCRALAKRKLWTVGEVYVDDDVSAYSGKPRPAWNRLVADVRSGTVKAITAWHVDRLTRAPRELEDVIGLAEQYGLQLATVGGEIDLATSSGRLGARIAGVVARHESEHKAERQRRACLQAAEAGKVSGGGMRPFGYADDKVTVVEDEAEIVRECAARLLGGWSLSAVCTELAARDVRTPQGNYWQPRTLRRLLASARISGRREHSPRPSGSSGTRPLLGTITAVALWPAIISVEDSDRLRTLLSDPARRRRFDGSTGRKYLLSGLLRCGKCGAGMVGRPRGSTPRYVCPNTPGGTSCGGMATVAAATDDLIRDMVLAALASPALAEHLTGDSADTSRKLAEERELLADLAGMLGRKELSRDEWQAARTPMLGRIEELERELHEHASATALADVDLAGDLHAAWESWPVGKRRAVVAAVVERITCHPANPALRWDPDRFEVTWRA